MTQLSNYKNSHQNGVPCVLVAGVWGNAIIDRSFLRGLSLEDIGRTFGQHKTKTFCMHGFLILCTLAWHVVLLFRLFIPLWSPLARISPFGDATIADASLLVSSDVVRLSRGLLLLCLLRCLSTFSWNFSCFLQHLDWLQTIFHNMMSSCVSQMQNISQGQIPLYLVSVAWLLLMQLGLLRL